jgi:hypothetical protein
MTLLDKAKVAAEKAAAVGKQGVQQGQAKIDAIQTKRKAYYAELRHGGSHDAVEMVVGALDSHEKEHGAVDDEPGETGTDETAE